jgi:hypothetical protein
MPSSSVSTPAAARRARSGQQRFQRLALLAQHVLAHGRAAASLGKTQKRNPRYRGLDAFRHALAGGFDQRS